MQICVVKKYNEAFQGVYFLSIDVAVEFFPWFKFYFPLFWGMVMYDNEF